MNDQASDRLRQSVIDAHPNSRTTYEIAYQLREILPIESPADLKERGRLSVGGEELPLDDLLPLLPEELFPIRDEDDLVEKVAAAVRHAGHTAQHHAPSGLAEAHARVLQELASEAGAHQAGAGFGHFRGPSIFGTERAKEA